MSIGLLGQKVGMTSVYDAKGKLCPVTVIAAGDNVLVRRLTDAVAETVKPVAPEVDRTVQEAGQAAQDTVAGVVHAADGLLKP